MANEIKYCIVDGIYHKFMDLYRRYILFSLADVENTDYTNSDELINFLFAHIDLFLLLKDDFSDIHNLFMSVLSVEGDENKCEKGNQ